MKPKAFFLALLALFFGVLIFIFSLVATSQKEELKVDKVSKKQFYFGEKVLPDHVLYPILMVIDRGLLAITTGESRIFLRIRLAQDRMVSAQKLLEKDEELLALSTLTKSQKYLILAAQEFLDSQDYPPEVGTALYFALQENTQNLSRIETDFTKVPTGPIGDLVFESEALLTVIKNKIP